MNQPKVFSYRRFSSGRQAAGHSLERQTEAARRWCKEHGLALDETLALSDLGVSAYSGDNMSKGALGGFLGAINAGKVPRGSILLVESLDRLSRAGILEAVNLLASIVKSGVRVVSFADGQEWNESNITDTMSFMYSVLLFSRAHEESATKGKRVRAAYVAKREAGLPVISAWHGSGWAIPRPDRSGWDVDQERAASIVKVFEAAVAGQGGVSIARKANHEGWVLPWRQRANTNTRWEHTGVSRILRDRRVLGEYQPMRQLQDKRVPDGQPVSNYFPRIVTDDLWYRAQDALKGRPGPKRIRGIKSDIFAGLLYCRCGERMERKAPTVRGYARYYCLGRKAGVSKCPPVAESVLLGPVLSAIAQVEQEEFNPNLAAEKARELMANAMAKSADAIAKAERIMSAIEEPGHGHNRFLLERLAAIEKDRDNADLAIESAKAALQAEPILDTSFGAEMAVTATRIVADKAASEDRHKLATALTRAVMRIEWNGQIAMVHLQSGTTLGINPDASLLTRAKNRKRKPNVPKAATPAPPQEPST